jgi:hypothetical protein
MPLLGGVSEIASGLLERKKEGSMFWPLPENAETRHQGSQRGPWLVAEYPQRSIVDVALLQQSRSFRTVPSNVGRLVCRLSASRCPLLRANRTSLIQNPMSAFDPKRTFLQSSLHKNTETQISFVGRVGERATDYQSPSGVTSVCPNVQFNIFDSQGSWRSHPRISHGASPSYDDDARSRVAPLPSS